MLEFKDLLRQNRIFFFLAVTIFLLASILLINIQKGDAILFINQHHSPFWDQFFKYGTKAGEWPGYVAAIALLLFYKYRHAIAIPLLAIIVTIVSFLGKEWFKVGRPKAFFTELGIFDQLHLVDGVKIHGSSTSFPSGHSMSGFALFAFLAFCLPYKKILPLVLFLLALEVGISRIYLVQHFLVDVLAGSATGFLLAIGWYLFHNQWGKPGSWLDRSLLS